MSTTDGAYSIRDCAREVIASIEMHPDAVPPAEDVRQAVQKLMRRPDLFSLGVKREANHIDASKWLYYDGQVAIQLDKVPKGKFIPPHDHGVWEAMTVVRGRLEHTMYERKDDESTPGFADLAVVDARVLAEGDFVMVAMPAEIHSFTALDDDTYTMTVVGGNYKPERLYFKPEEKTYVVRRPKAA